MSNISFNISTTKPKIGYDIKLMKTGKSEYNGTFDLSMPDGDQVITPNEGKVFSKVTVKKPDTMVPENIRKGTDIGGVVGTMTPPQPDMLQQLVDLNNKIVGLSNNPTVTNYDFLENLDTSKVTNFSKAFAFDNNLTRVPESWDTSNVTIFDACFETSYSIKDIPKWDTSNGKSFYRCFYASATRMKLDKIPDWNLQNAENLESMFYFTSIKEAKLDIPKAKRISNLFEKCSFLTEVELTNTYNLENIGYTFYNCSNLETVNDFICDNITYASSTFYNCSLLKQLPNLKFKKSVYAAYFCTGCYKLLKIPNIFDDKANNLSGIAQNCYALEDCELNMLNCTSNNSMLYGCTNLTNLKLHNIKINTAIGSGISYGTKLTQESLIFCIKELWSYKDTTTTRTLTISTPSKTLIADIYVKLITPTQEQIETDPYINNKLPCEVCESTDEGAMTITAYANLKNWTIA